MTTIEDYVAAVDATEIMAECFKNQGIDFTKFDEETRERALVAYRKIFIFMRERIGVYKKTDSEVGAALSAMLNLVSLCATKQFCIEQSVELLKSLENEFKKCGNVEAAELIKSITSLCEQGSITSEE